MPCASPLTAQHNSNDSFRQRLSHSVDMDGSAHTSLRHSSYEESIQPPTTDAPTPTDEESCSRQLEQKGVPVGEQQQRSSSGRDLLCHPGKRVKYPSHLLTKRTAQQIKEMRRYYTSEFNLKRNSECMHEQGTFAKLKERFYCLGSPGTKSCSVQ